MLKRESLVQFRQASITADLAEAMRVLETQAAEFEGVRIDFKGTPAHEMSWEHIKENPGPTNCKPQWSLKPAGREIYLSLDFTADAGSSGTREERALALLWGLAVPLGFTPWMRNPVPGPWSEVFHYYGPWQMLYDNLMADGRGEEAWPSLCVAAQSDIGAWRGNRRTERFVQAQLHRMGVNCGPIDGIIGERTQEALRGIGIYGRPMDEIAKNLISMDTAEVPKEERRKGYVIIPGGVSSVASYGQIQSVRTAGGVALTIDGPGRVVVDVHRGAAS